MGGSSNRKAALTVRTTPPIDDPRELVTILTFSLRHLFGELEGYSSTLQIRRAVSDATFVVECPSDDSVDDVRAALTMVTPPPYLDEITYQFDVVNVQQQRA